MIEQPNLKVKLHIAILAHSLRVGGGVSVGLNMISALGRVAPQHTYLFTIPSRLGYEEICKEIPKCKTEVYEHGSLLKRWCYEAFRLPRLVRAFHPDVVFSLSHCGLLKPPCPQAVLMHIAVLVYPPTHYGLVTTKTRFILCYHKYRFKRQLENTQLLFAQTSVMESRLRHTYRYKGQIAICPNAVSKFVTNHDRKLSMPKPLIPYADKMKLFCPTKYYGHKNLEIFLELFRRFSDELRDVVVVTTIAANQYKYAAEFLRSIEKRGLNRFIINVGPLEQSELAAYYRYCQGTLLPTLLESFSGTYLEAMYFGCPILTSDLDFARVVCGDAALYFDPYDAASIKDTILRLRRNPQLSEELITKGRSLLQSQFRSWDEIASEVILHLERLAGSSL